MHLRAARIGSLVSVAVFLTAVVSGCGQQADREPEAVDIAGVFAAAGEATSYRLTTFTAQKISSSLLGVDTETEIDEDSPTTVAEVTPEASHVVVDIAAALGPAVGVDTEIGLEMWVSPARVTIDSRDYAKLKERNPGADLGPLAPGIAYIDRQSDSVDDADLLSAILGQGIPDLREVAADLPGVLEDIEQDGSTITGVGSYADVLDALGQDVEQMARSVAGGLALNLGVAVDELTDFYVEYYESTQAAVTVEVDAEGSLSALGFTVDLGGIFSRILEEPDLFTDRPSEEELADARDMASDSEWEITVLQRYELDDDLVVDDAPPTDDDRTDQWVTFLKNSGF